MSEYQDFQEIAHCGGQATITIACDGQGKKSVSAGFRHSRPVPATVVGVYALFPQGLAVADFIIGGISDVGDPRDLRGFLPVFLASDSHGRWGHQCPDCSGYFRNSSHSALFPLTCPYCGLRSPAHTFLTPSQQNYIRHYVETVARSFANPMEPRTERETIIDIDAIVAQEKDEPKPDFYYSTLSQQTRFTCEKCGQFNDIRGRFGYCAACSYRNNLPSLKTSYDALRKSVNERQISAEGAVRAAISEFGSCCRDMSAQLANRISMKPDRQTALQRFLFHDLDASAVRVLKEMFDIDLLRGLDAETKFLKMMTERRHIFEHNAGVADEKYVRASGDLDGRAGVIIRESIENAHRLINNLTRIFTNFDNDFQQIFELTEWPINNHREKQGRYQRRAAQQRGD